MQEVGKSVYEATASCAERGAIFTHIPVQTNDGTDTDTIAVQRLAISITVEKIRERSKTPPLLTVMSCEPGSIDTGARSF
jgi:hypothetical protein